MAKIVQKTYGEALYELAMQENPTELLREAGQLEEILRENPEFDKLMKHPGIAKQEKQKILKEVWEGKINPVLLGFLDLLITKDRYAYLPQILEYFTDKMKETQKIGVAYVTTAVELTGEKKAEIEKKLLDTTEYETFEMHYKVDTSILGGMIVRIKDRVVDSSIKSKLNGLTKELLQIQLG